MAVAARTAKRLMKTKVIIDAQYLVDNVLYMKNDIIAINKPYGLPVHAGPGIRSHLSEMLEEFAAIKNIKVKPELAHRLDKDSTGVLILTRSVRAAQKVAEMFHNRKVVKKYWAIVVGVPRFEEGEIKIPVGEAKFGKWHKMTACRDFIGKSPKELRAAGFNEAITRFQVLDSNGSTCSLLEVNPQTGHKQQIRVHMAEGLHCPILGDHKFSAEKPQPQVLSLRMLQLLQIRGVKDQTDTKGKGKIRDWQRALIPLHLHARELTLPGFNSGKDVVITAPLPDYFEETLEKCRLHPKRKTMQQSRDENDFFRLKRLGISTNKISGF